MKAKGLTRNITRKQALSYEMTPNARARRNGLGVTAIASVNGSRRTRRRTKRSAEYTRRYAATAALLRGAGMKKRGKRKAKSRRNPAQVATKGYRSGWARIWGGKTKRASTKTSPSKTTKRASRVARAAPKKKTVKRKASPKLGRRYGKFKSLTARVGLRKRPTVLHMKKGKVQKIPFWALMGQKSPSAFKRRLAESPRLARRVAAAKRRREKAAARVLLHGDAFTPNPGSRVVPFETWSETMTKKRKRKGKKSRKHAKRPVGRKVRRHAAKRRHTRAAAPKRRRRRVHAKRRAHRNTAASPNKKRRAHAKRRGVHKIHWAHPPKPSTKKRRSVRKALHSRFGGTWYENNIGGAVAAAPNRRRRRHAKRRTHYEDNRRHTAKRRGRHVSFWARRNPDFAGTLKTAFKGGVIVAVGFFGHKGLSKVVSDQLGKMTMFQSGAAATWRTTIAGVLLAAVGVPLAAKFMPGAVKEVGAGIALSVLQSALMTGLVAANQPDVAGYFAGYPDAPGSPFGEFFMAQPSGQPFGEFFMAQQGVGAYELSPMSGFGATPMITQAAAGYGAAPMFTQAAAGYGQITQAAAGVGEYFVTGVEGIGEYELTPVPGSMNGLGQTAPMEGIMPDLTSAERALTVAEAAAGVGGLGDVPFESIVDPTGVAVPVSDAPMGSRAGILQGGDGIFS